MSRKALALLLLLLPGLAVGQSSRTGRVTEGTLATRPACPSPASNGDEYLANDQVPVAKFVCDAARGWLSIGAYGPVLPNTVVSFSATPNFSVGTNASYSMTLTGNVTSSTTSGASANGALLSLTLLQDGTGGRTFNFPANFTVPAGFTLDTTAGHTNALTWKYDGTNWNLVSNSGGGTGCTAAGNTGDLQEKGVSGCAASGANDDGTNLEINRNTSFLGPNPYIDVTTFNMRATASQPTTTGSINSGSATLTVASGTNFRNGDGVAITGAGATIALSTPSAPTVTAVNAAGPIRTGQVIANSAGATTYQYQIVARTGLKGYTVPSSATSIANGAATLGKYTVAVSSWSRSGVVVTVNTSTPHGLVTGADVSISGDNDIAGGRWIVTVTGASQFTYSGNKIAGNNVRASGTTGGTVTAYVGNHISWAAVTNTWVYCIYGNTAGSMNLIGVSYPESTDSRVQSDPLYNTFDDWGSPITTAPVETAACPTALPAVAANNTLVTTIVSGGGTNTLTLAATASNTVAGARVAFDNGPNFTAAINAATLSGTSQVSTVYFPCPAGGQGSSYFFDTVMFLGAGSRTLSVMQCGNISANDTFIFGKTIWSGFPRYPSNSSSFGYDFYPVIQGGASILTYLNDKMNFDHVMFKGNATNGQTLALAESNNGIPSNQWDHVAFSFSGSGDYTSVGLLERQGILGGAVETFRFVNFAPGTASSSAPMFLRTRNGGVYTFEHVFLNKRGLAWGGGSQVTAFDIYEQAADVTNCKITMGNFAGTLGNIFVKNSIEDTTFSPVICYYGGIAGTISIVQSNGTAGPPIVQGDSGMAVVSYGVGSTASIGIGQNIGSEFQLTKGTSIDGIVGSSPSSYPQKVLNGGLQLGSIYKSFIVNSPQAAPTCAVSAGGSVAVNSYVFSVAPSYGDGGEGVASPLSTTCSTTPGNQTITITWVAASPAPVGYNLYQNGFSFQCAPPWVAGGASTQYVWSSAAPCGQSQPTQPGGGPTSITQSAVYSPSVKLSGGNGGGLVSLAAPTVTAPRTANFSDNTGTVLLDSTATSAAGLAPTPYDNFNRANGGLGSNWTSNLNGNGAMAISSNTVIGGSASSDTNSYWNANAFLNDQYCEVTITATSGNQEGCSVRNSGTSNATTNFYVCRSSTALLQLWKVVNGAISSVTSTGFTHAVGDRIRLTAVGSALTCSSTAVNGTITSISGSDGAITSGAPGIMDTRNTGGLVNWTGGSLPKNAAFVTNEQEFTSNQYFSGAVVVGAFPSTTSGTALAAGTTYTRKLVLGDVGAQSTSLASASGNSGRVGQTSGTLTFNNLASWDANGNGVDAGVPVPFTCTNVTPVTVSANVATDQLLQACTIPAGTLNRVGRSLRIWAAGVYSTEVANVSTVTLKAKLCTVSGCGSGTVITLQNIPSAANAGGVTTLPFNANSTSTVQTAGASAAFESHGKLSIDLTAVAAADAVYNDGNTATVGTIDSTAQLFLQITGTFSVAGGAAGNIFTQRQLVVETIN